MRDVLIRSINPELKVWDDERHGIAPWDAQDFVEQRTALIDITSKRQLKKGVLMFWDEKFQESYSVYLVTGYVRRGTSHGFGGAHRVNPHVRCNPFRKDQVQNRVYGLASYQLNPRDRSPFRTTVVKLFPYDLHTLVQIMLRAYTVRHKRCKMTRLGPLAATDIARCNLHLSPSRQVEILGEDHA